VVPTYGREEVLCETLRSLLGLDLQGCEITVVDQNARHEPLTHDYLSSIAGRIRLLQQSPSLPRARNAGWRAAAGDIVLYLDDDVIPHPGLIEAHCRAYDNPAVGGVAGRVRTIGFPAPEVPASRSRWPVVGWLFFNLAQTVPAEVATARGCNMSFRRALLEELRGFDERYAPSPYRNESDFCFRVRQRGYRLVFVPEAAVDHLMHETGGVRGGGRDESLRPEHHVDNFRFFWTHISWHHRPLTLLAFLAQELLTRRARSAARGWRQNAAVLTLFARGLCLGYRSARSGPWPSR